MKKFFALIGMQLRDKVDLSWTHSAKEIIKKIVFSVVRFTLVFVFVYALLYVGKQFSVFFYSESLRVSILIITIMFFLSLISCTVGITQSLYFNQDKTIKYIADIFSLSENTVRDYVNRYKHANTEVS